MIPKDIEMILISLPSLMRNIVQDINKGKYTDENWRSITSTNLLNAAHAVDTAHRLAPITRVWKCTQKWHDFEGGVGTDVRYAKTEADMLILKDQGFKCVEIKGD